MIVVVGSPRIRTPNGDNEPAGLAGAGARIASAAAAAGASVQLVGKIGDDDAGDAAVLALGRSGVGHAALLRDAGESTRTVAPEPGDGPDPLAGGSDLAPEKARDSPASRLEAADLELALRYLTDFRVVVLAEALHPDAAGVLADAVSYTGAHLILALPPGVESALSTNATTVLQAPEFDPDGAFARLVGSYAAALDRGVQPDEGFRNALGDSGWEAAAD